MKALTLGECFWREYFKEVIKVVWDDKSGLFIPCDLKENKDKLRMCSHRKKREQQEGSCQSTRAHTHTHTRLPRKLTIVWASSLLKWEKINLCCLSHSACSVLCWQPRLTVWCVNKGTREGEEEGSEKHCLSHSTIFLRVKCLVRFKRR